MTISLTELNRLAELSEKATQGEWSPSNDGYTAIEDKDGNVLYYDEGTATTENNELICTLVNFFRASLPALREAAQDARRYRLARKAIVGTDKGDALADLGWKLIDLQTEEAFDAAIDAKLRGGES